MSARFRSERGQALLEVAMTLPLVLLVSVSIFAFGRAYQTWQIMTNAAREGARIAVLPGTSDADIKNRVKEYLTAGQLSEAPNATVDIDHNATVDIGTGTAPATGVTVNYPFSFIVLNPVAKLVVSNSGTGLKNGSAAFTMVTSALMRNE
jgi:Flp pilus assembly protein TadG